MLQRLKSTFYRRPDPAIPDESYVAGRGRDDLPIEHAVSTQQVEAALNGTMFNWTCTGCGKCCNGPGVVYFTKTDLENIKKLLELDSAEWAKLRQRLVQKKTNGLFVHDTVGACIFLKDSSCTIYEARPLQCRTYPFWTSCFEDAPAHRALREYCPGVSGNEGEHFSVWSITRNVNCTADDFNRSQTAGKKTLYL